MSDAQRPNPSGIDDLSAALDQISGQEPQKPAATPIVLKLNGKEVPYADADQLSRDLEAVLIRQRELEDKLMAQKPAQPQPVGQMVTGEETEQWSKDKFAEMLVDDPRKALDYVDRVTGKKKEIETLKQQLTQAQMLIAQAQTKEQIATFMAQARDFDPQPQNFQVLDQLLKANNLPITAQTLGMAYSFAKQNGMVQIRQDAEPQQYEQYQYGDQQNANNVYQMQQPRPQQPARPVGLPSVPRSGLSSAVDENTYRKAENLSAAQLRQLIENMSGQS